MIKRRYLLILIVLIVLLAVLVVWFIKRDERPSSSPTTSINKTETEASALKLNGRKVINLPEGNEKEALQKIKPTNTISKDWKQGVEKNLRIQGGNSLKNIQVEKIESLIWNQNGLALNVESIRITLTNNKGERTSFRAMVDSQSGKILQTWDQPVNDPINPRENFGIKVDPRYHQ